MSPRRALLVRIVLLIGLTVCAARMLAPTVFRARSGDVAIRLSPNLPGGRLILPLGPLGELSWRTHSGPINVEANFVLDRGLDRLPGLAEFGDLRWRVVARKAPWLLLFGALGGALAVPSMRRRSLAIAASAGAGGTLAAASLVVGVSALTFDAGALDSPRYRGPLGDVPRILRLASEIRDDLGGFERNIGKLAAGLQRIHAQIVAGTPAPAGPGVRMLVMADLHNNPIGLAIARELASRFEADAILNAGDFTDRGTRAEGELYAAFARFERPQLVVAGNHEDRAALERIARIPGLRVLSSATTDTAEVEGIVVLGEADPNSDFIGDDPDNEIARERIPAICEALAARTRRLKAHVLLVHDPRLGRCAADEAEHDGRHLTFVWGHLHRASFDRDGTVVSISPGTSGANGLKTGREAPYGFALLDFDPVTRRLTSVCTFALDDPGSLRLASCHGISTRDDSQARALPPERGLR